VVDTPSDRSEMNGDFRESPEHMTDLGAAVRWAHEKFGRPVWLVGTSRGTQSAAAAALALKGAEAPDGLVLTSSVLGRNPRAAVTVRAVNEMELGTLAMPVLVAHHEQDPCNVCDPAQLLTFTGGRSFGPPCEAQSYHGFNGIEDRVVAGIGAWIRERR
jgi:hypothetical protein